MKCPDCGHNNLDGAETCDECSAPMAQLSIPQSDGKGKDQRKILDGTIRELKPRAALCVAPDSSVAEAVRLMREGKVGCILAVQKGKLKGIFTERDLLMKVAGLKAPEKVRIADVMKAEVQSLNEDDTVAFAFHEMAVKAFRHIPVKRTDGSLGIISSRDLLAYLCK